MYIADDDMNEKTIWKRDLWKAELHTIPFQPIHEELLYGVSQVKSFDNEYMKAKRHFETQQR